MATITGFTAERMLVIENETVVDGEVRGNNLYLQRRDGVEIDAGWVKGAPGGSGPAGSPGVIQSLNDEVKPFAYSPRQFDSKASLDAWTSAPYGSIGVVRDGTSNIIWQKDNVGWFAINGMRTFADVAERDSRWPNPPDGSICQAPPGTEFRRINGAWVSSAYPPLGAPPIIGWIDAYQGSKNPGSYTSTQYSLPAPVVPSRCLLTFGGHHGFAAGGNSSNNFTWKRVSPAQDIAGSGGLQIPWAGVTVAIPTLFGMIDPINPGVIEKLYLTYTIAGSNNYFSPKFSYFIVPK